MLELVNNKVWLYFVQHPNEKIHIRAIARSIGTSAPYVLDAIVPLKKMGLIKTATQGRNTLLFAVRSDSFTFYKRWTNLFLLLESGVIEELITQHPDTIVLFGSYARGEDNEQSDIDICTDAELDAVKMDVFQSKLSRVIQVHPLSELQNKQLKENIRQGILLYGVMP